MRHISVKSGTRIASAISASVCVALASAAVSVAKASQPPPGPEPCQPHWDITIGQPGLQSGSIWGHNLWAIAVWDDYPGADEQVVFVGGWPFLLAAWNGTSWSSFSITGGTGCVHQARAMTVFDEPGSGPALFAVGTMHNIEGASFSGIARYDGTEWSSVGGGLGVPGCSPAALSLEVFDDGSGPALYVGGNFVSAGGQPIANLARWDGQTWSQVGGGVVGLVRAMAVFDDGSGPALFVGGFLTSAGDVPVDRVAKWDGSEWHPVGTGIGAPETLAVYDDGAGAALYAGGGWTSVNGEPGSVAKWTGESWVPLDVLGTGGLIIGGIRAMEVFDPGDGERLYIGGTIEQAGGEPHSNLVAWDGSNWTSPAGALNGGVLDLATRQTPDGPRLLVSGKFTTIGDLFNIGVAEWDGEIWHTLGGGFPMESAAATYALISTDAVGDDALYVGGAFQAAGGSTSVMGLARWDGRMWAPLAREILGTIRSLAVHDDGSGPALYVGGVYTVDGVEVRNMARWDGESWAQVGSGLIATSIDHITPLDGTVHDLVVFDEGDGPVLIAGGSFMCPGDSPPACAGQCGGQSPVGCWCDDSCFDFMDCCQDVCFYCDSWDGVYSCDISHGINPCHGGLCLPPCAEPLNRVARWDGTGWSPLGEGVHGTVYALAVFDDGDGPVLHAAGDFAKAGDQEAWNIARWDGKAWSGLGSGTNGEIMALTVHDDGSGPALYAGGSFTFAGYAGDVSAAVPASRIARWDGEQWYPVGGGIDDGVVHALVSHTPGESGPPNLIVGGEFLNVDGAPIRRVAKWDGRSWSPLGDGIGNGAVRGLEPYHVGEDRVALAVVGTFSEVDGQPANSIALWNDCPGLQPIPGDLTGDGSVGVDDLLILLADWGACPDPDDCPADLTGDDSVGVDDLLILLANWG